MFRPVIPPCIRCYPYSNPLLISQTPCLTGVLTKLIMWLDRIQSRNTPVFNYNWRQLIFTRCFFVNHNSLIESLSILVLLGPHTLEGCYGSPLPTLEPTGRSHQVTSLLVRRPSTPTFLYVRTQAKGVLPWRSSHHENQDGMK